MRRLLVDELGIPDAEVLEEAFVSPLPGAPAAPDEPPTGADDAAAPATVRFARAGRTIDVEPGLTLLEAAEDAGIAIPFECRSGICGQCKTRLISGRVTMPVQDALAPSDRARGLVLACQARAIHDIVVDA
ncbi:MAG: 2Fe-2S iron-sulfur cluster binding domain-containing protein [Deltaproteobacteria bacterium]|nr:2Fe-2S iron-sulfur cluster binding domain-containing protein [Deltaproteobacteria bacterium]